MWEKGGTIHFLRQVGIKDKTSQKSCLAILRSEKVNVILQLWPFYKDRFLAHNIYISTFIKRTQPWNVCASSIYLKECVFCPQCNNDRCLQPPLVSTETILFASPCQSIKFFPAYYPLQLS